VLVINLFALLLSNISNENIHFSFNFTKQENCLLQTSLLREKKKGEEIE